MDYKWVYTIHTREKINFYPEQWEHQTYDRENNVQTMKYTKYYLSSITSRV